MSIVRSTLLGFLTVACLVMLAGCGDPSEKLIGAWKSEAASTDTGKHHVVLLTKDSANINGVTSPVEYRTLAVNTEVFDTGKQQALFSAAKVDKISMEATGEILGGKIKLLRITEEEAFQLLKDAQPQEQAPE